jgi:type IV secretion system protein VirB1
MAVRCRFHYEATMLSTTAFLAAAMQCAASVHPSTALDVARVESGFHPYAIAEICRAAKA